ncbi:MAG: 2OG-Fe dioxygenase family protein [Rudaea sp.]|uniref:2OG-Fe dioxygenase family protein n=1 Tax=Rudaea sp. TaxID=2136325 RepID=UPI0039E3E6B4
MSHARAVHDDDLSVALTRDGFAFVAHARMRGLLDAVGKLGDWPAFAASWNDLALDTYLADFGRYRRRRHAVFRVERGGAVVHEAHQPHYQSREYNALQGGIERWFEPITPEIRDGATLRTLLDFCRATFGPLAPDAESWRVEVHQFRIEARPDEPGQPTPEGVHRDGVDYVLVLLVDRVNIASGTTTIHAAATRELLGSFTLTKPLDAALVDDARVFHGVTPVEPIDPALPAYRDVLVVTFKRAPRS